MNQAYSFLNFNMGIVGPGGAFSIGNGSGVADEGVTFSPTGEISTMTIGADGNGMHTLHADKSGTITVRLLKTSPTNALLSLMYAFQTSNAANHGQNTITGVDSARGDVITCFQVAFSKAPDLTYAKEASLVEWEFKAVRIERLLGAGQVVGG
jgi:Protein of unknown function (DUF3277)